MQIINLEWSVGEAQEGWICSVSEMNNLPANISNKDQAVAMQRLLSRYFMVFFLIVLQHCLGVFTHSIPEVKTSRKFVKIA